MKVIQMIILFAALQMFVGCNDAQPRGEKMLTIPFKCNGYVTPLDASSKQTPSCANLIVHNDYNNPHDAEMVVDGWKREYVEAEPHQLSIFFYTAHTGYLDLSLVVGSVAGNASLDVEVESKTRRVEVVASRGEHTCYVGGYNISEPGYVRVNIIPVATSADSYPTISALKVGGAAVGNATSKNESVVFVSAEDCRAEKPHFIRRGPSNHFQWAMPDDTEYFYNEVHVAEGNDINGAYYMLTGGDGFYMGIQPNVKGENRFVLFSVWDTDTAAGDIATLVNKGEGVRSNNYSHEGSGVQTFYNYDWEAGRTYATLVRVRPEVIDGKLTGASLYTGYFRGDEGWAFIAEIRRPNIVTYFTGAHSFCENFIPERGWVEQSVMYPSQWMRDKDGKWHEVLSGRFTCDNTGRRDMRRDYSGGVNEQGYFYLRNIGYIDEMTPHGVQFTRQPSGVAPDIDLAALEQMAKAE